MNKTAVNGTEVTPEIKRGIVESEVMEVVEKILIEVLMDDGYAKRDRIQHTQKEVITAILMENGYRTDKVSEYLNRVHISVPRIFGEEYLGYITKMSSSKRHLNFLLNENGS